MNASAIVLHNVTRTEKGVSKPLLSSISATIPAGRLVALVGADGAGKTTLMRVLAGLLKPQSGNVEILGGDVYQNVARAQALCGYMPQKFGLYADLSVQENLTLYADLFGLDEVTRQTRFKELLEMTDLTRFTDREAGRLSGGMKQKLGLACALLNRPQVLLLDEPSVGVDPLSRRDLWKILDENVRDEGMTVVVATTYMDEAAQCDWVIVLEDGELVLTEKPETIAASATNLTYLIEPKPTEKTRDLQARLLDDRAYFLDAVPEAGKVRVLMHPAQTIEAVRSAYPDYEFESVDARLEDGYLIERFRQGRFNAIAALDQVAVQEDLDRTKPVVEARDLVRRFGDFVAVDKTSFEVYPGDIFGLLGPNGAGKTTTFKMLCGLLTVSDGELKVTGINVKDAREEARQHLGYMSQKFALYGELSVKQNMEFFAGAYGLFRQKAKERIEKLVKEFQLSEVIDAPAKTLPGGVKQRLAMAVALLHRPRILFLDEPTSGADVPTRRQFWRWMTALAAQGTTIIVTTHFMEEALYCDRLLIQDAGESVVLGTPQEVRGEASTMDEAFIRIVENARVRRGGGA
ncbi:MAG: ABC transporter ATP-binding protein [Burkholderiaceae bacterium]|nr:ABC transporter ATP-binding protein [Burkholderiaceae bacterium]